MRISREVKELELELNDSLIEPLSFHPERVRFFAFYFLRTRQPFELTFENEYLPNYEEGLKSCVFFKLRLFEELLFAVESNSVILLFFEIFSFSK